MADTERQRIDKWLFFARIAKSRTIAAKMVQAGKVRVNREKIELASHAVKAGDVLTIALERRVMVCRVVSGGSRRGPAPEARLLYEDLSPPPPDPLPGTREPGMGRPTKQDRRALDRLRGGDGT